MQKKLISALLLGATLTTAANASVIHYSSRFSTHAAFTSATAAADYKNYIDGLTAVAPTAGYCDKSLSSFSGVSNQAICRGGNSNIAFHFQVLFGVNPSDSGNWSFQAGVDFGRGGAMFIDGSLAELDSSDMWWAGKYTLSTEVLAAGNKSLLVGNHVLDIYGLEGCCDGAQEARFQIGNQPWTTFSSNDGHRPVPLPATLALLGIGGVCLRWSRKN